APVAVEPLEGLVASASEELVAEPANLMRDIPEHGAGALDASAAEGEALALDDGGLASDADWAVDVSHIEGLDLITADGVDEKDDEPGPSPDLAMIDLDDTLP